MNTVSCIKSLILTVLLIFCASCPAAVRKLVAAEGRGYLEIVDGYRVLHLKGSPAEMGYQHGVLLKESIRQNIDFMLQTGVDDGVEINGQKIARSLAAGVLLSVFEEKVPARYVEEMQGLAKGAGIAEWKVKAVNLIPELMHCSGFALMSKATATGKLYHGRVLDYGVDMHLQDHAVLIIQEPEGKIPFVNVGYAGFIGSVTGMNIQQISIGEMGGGGVGQWDGIPMSFLVRMVLEDSDSLEKAIDVFRNNKRTCEYYYVIADAEIDDAVGIKAVPDEVEIVRAGQMHPQLPHPVENTVLMSSGDRYINLSRLVKEGYGKFTEQSAVRLMDAPVAMKSNLHDALMVPQDGIIYVANAAKDKSPAWKQKYYRFNVNELIRDRPGEVKVTYRNPIIEKIGPADPAVIKYKDKYYMYPTWNGRGYHVFVSDDLVNWSQKPMCYTDSRGGMWAPDVFHNKNGDGKFYLYYTANNPGGGKLIGVAVADHPLGQFVDKGNLVEDNIIDAHLFEDDDGRMYLYYVKIGDPFRIFVQQMDDPLTLTGRRREVIRPTEAWEQARGRVTEGPWMLKHNGLYYLMYSGSGANGPEYSIGYATGKSPLGPFTKYEDNPIARQGKGVYGPGHHCVVEGPDGNLWMVYHQQNSTKVSWERFLAIDPIWFDDNGIIKTEVSRDTDRYIMIKK